MESHHPGSPSIQESPDMAEEFVKVEAAPSHALRKRSTQNKNPAKPHQPRQKRRQRIASSSPPLTPFLLRACAAGRAHLRHIHAPSPGRAAGDAARPRPGLVEHRRGVASTVPRAIRRRLHYLLMVLPAACLPEAGRWSADALGMAEDLFETEADGGGEWSRGAATPRRPRALPRRPPSAKR